MIIREDPGNGDAFPPTSSINIHNNYILCVAENEMNVKSLKQSKSSSFCAHPTDSNYIDRSIPLGNLHPKGVLWGCSVRTEQY